MRTGDREVLRRIYAAVRDENWDTVLPTLASRKIEQRNDSFAVTFAARHTEGPIAFCWEGRIEGLADGTISALLTNEVSPNATLTAFQSSYQSQFGTPSTPFAEATYDSIMMLKQAIESAKSADPRAVQNAFNHISGYQGLTGTLSFSPSKHTTINADQLTLVKYDAASGKWVPVG